MNIGKAILAITGAVAIVYLIMVYLFMDSRWWNIPFTHSCIVVGFLILQTALMTTLLYLWLDDED